MKTISFPTPENSVEMTTDGEILGDLKMTKNINMDENGFIKLSQRVAAVASRRTDNNFRAPVALSTNGSCNIATNLNPYTMNITDTGVSVVSAADATLTSTDINSDVATFSSACFVTSGTGIFKKTTGTWSSVYSGLTSNVPHPLEPFINRATLAVGNGNTVLQFDSAMAAGSTLTIPSDFIIKSLAYNASKMGVIANSTIEGDAFFFIWDGATTSANSGWSVGAKRVDSIVAYKSSWVILTSAGELLYFNGGGFTRLDAVPYYYSGMASNGIYTGHKNMFVRGDKIFLMLDNRVNNNTSNENGIITYAHSGLWCYDPRIGVYHRNGLSLSTINRVAVTTSFSSNTITAFSGTAPDTGAEVVLSSVGGNTVSPNLVVGGRYYSIKIDDTHFKLASTLEDALSNTPMTITSTITSEIDFMWIENFDMSSTYVSRIASVMQIDNTYVTNSGTFIGSEIDDGVSAKGVVAVTMPPFTNHGYFVTSVMRSDQLREMELRTYVKHRAMKYGDSISLKVKTEKVQTLPYSSVKRRVETAIPWTSTTTFTLDSAYHNLAYIMEYLAREPNGLECEILCGPGAGYMAQVSSITQNSSTGVYTVTLATEIPGVIVGRNIQFIFDNWKPVTDERGNSEITSTNQRDIEIFPINKVSKMLQVKVILKGVEVAIENITITKTSIDKFAT